MAMRLHEVAVLLFLNVFCRQAVVLQGVRPRVEHLSPYPCSAAELEHSDPALISLNSELERAARGGSAGSDVVYMLKPGEHCVWNYSLVQDLVNLTFQGPAVINCTSGIGLAFFNVRNLQFTQLIIDSCGLEPNHVKSFLFTVKISIDYFFELSNTPDQYIGMALGECTDFHMEDCIISNTEGLGLLGINIVGHSSLENVTIEQNVPRGCFGRVNFNFTTEKVGGGALFSYHDYNASNSPLPSCLEIIDSKFLRNSYCGYGPIFESYYVFDNTHGGMTNLSVGAGGGLSFILSQFDYNVTIKVNGSTFCNNTSLYGGGAHVQLFSGVPDSHVLFDNCIFEFNGVDVSFIEYGISGSALQVFKDFIQPNFNLRRIKDNYTPSEVTVVNSVFRNNTAFVGTIEVFSLFNFVLAQHSKSEIVFENCTIECNVAILGAGLYVEEWKGNIFQLGTSLVLKDVQFNHNTIHRDVSLQSPFQSTSIVAAKTVNLTLSGNTLISHNTGTGMSASSSNIHVQGNATFFNNSGSYGGGLSLSDSSTILVSPNATLGFYQNKGFISGGAIFVNVFTTSQDCFIYFGTLCISVFSVNCPDITKLGAEVIFEGNQAPQGSMIYGSTLNSCPWSGFFREKYAPGTSNTNLLQLFYENQSNFTSPFKFDRAPNQVIAVTTPTTHMTVEFPNMEQQNSSLPISLSPGIKYRLNVTAYDGFNQAIPTVITSASLTPNTTSQVGNSNFHFLNYNVSETELLIYGDTNQSGVDVTLLTVETYTQVDLMVEITNCPDGYYIKNNSRSCICRENLVSRNFNCTEDGLILVPYGIWIGKEPDGALSFGECPLDYCNPAISILSVISTSSSLSGSGSYSYMSLYDLQCNKGYNRGGVACGGCVEGHSAVFGSNRCRKCNNNYLWLLLLFAAYGIILMLLIMFFQFTISDGFLNGVLFFSNILTVYLPYFSGSSKVSLYFVVFFWLSLKVGFETCFFDGMTTLASTFLHFVFPAYLYFLLLIIVLLSRWSTRFSRLLAASCRGFSPTKLFVTILVMTYSSLLETCIAVLSFTVLVDVDTNAKSHHWRYDPSVTYFHGYHAALGVLSLLLLAFFLIPSPFLWMFPSKVTSITLFRRFTPLYDAVWAPLKPRYRFWVSFRLILRVIPLVIINFSPIPINLLVLCLFLLVLLYLHGVLQPFQGRAQNVIDSLFQVELISIALLSLYFTILDLSQNAVISDVEAAMRSNQFISQLDEAQHGLVILAAISSYLTFVVVLVWHIFLKFPMLRKFAVWAWNAVMCKIFQLKQQKTMTITNTYSTTNEREISLSYSSTNGDKEKISEQMITSHDPKHPEVATFSELREPLLESGLAEIYEVEASAN